MCVREKIFGRICIGQWGDKWYFFFFIDRYILFWDSQEGVIQELFRFEEQLVVFVRISSCQLRNFLNNVYINIGVLFFREDLDYIIDIFVYSCNLEFLNEFVRVQIGFE